MNSIDFFVKNWCSNHAMMPLDNVDIVELEEKLVAVLPDSYKYLLSHYGLLHTPNVMTKTCDLGVEFTQVQDFLSLEDVASLSKLYEMTGMPKGHILFASDCKGNMFCFKLSDCLRSSTDIPVWFYDQEQRSLKKVANTFSAWLAEFN